MVWLKLRKVTAASSMLPWTSRAGAEKLSQWLASCDQGERLS
jgi:hypothetical protein